MGARSSSTHRVMARLVLLVGLLAIASATGQARTMHTDAPPESGQVTRPGGPSAVSIEPALRPALASQDERGRVLRLLPRPGSDGRLPVDVGPSIAMGTRGGQGGLRLADDPRRGDVLRL